MSSKKSLIFIAIAISLVGIVTGFFMGGHLLTSLPIGARIFIFCMAILVTLCVALEEGIMVLNERNRLVYTAIAISLVGIITGLFIVGDLVPSQAKTQQGMLMSPGVNEVWIPSRAFVPMTLTVPVGTTITWTNKDGQRHTVTSDVFDETLLPRGSFSYNFTMRGTYSYFCRPHTEKLGTIIVQ